LEFQFHPASGSGAVRSLVLGDRGEKAAVLLVGAAAVAALSLWVTVPAVVARALSEEASDALAKEGAAMATASRSVQMRAAGVAGRARDAGSMLSRIAFLYGIAPALWPRALNPEAGLLADSDPERLTATLPRFLVALERGRVLLSEREAADPQLAARTPAILPLGTEVFEPSVFFGPRVSPWTGAEEFFTGLAIAAPAGTPVLAPADGTVVFAGRVAPSARTRLWRYGNLVVLSHGKDGATLFGHLARIEARRGQRIRRGGRLGTVGSTGWTMFPSLHYELWRGAGGRLSPTDPRFGILDQRLGPADLSLEKMAATSAPGPVEPLPAR